MIGAALTAVALALILSFKTPDATGLATAGSNGELRSLERRSAGTTTARRSRAPFGAGLRDRDGAATKSTFSGQLTGQAVQIPSATVQVQVTMQNGQITDVKTLQMPADQRRSQQISQYVAPQLRSEVLSAQSAQVNTISGATYTSMGYLQSLQSALDQA